MENQVPIPSTPDVSHPLKSILPTGMVHLIPQSPTGPIAKCQMAEPAPDSLTKIRPIVPLQRVEAEQVLLSHMYCQPHTAFSSTLKASAEAH